jgi:hypothetical protein
VGRHALPRRGVLRCRYGYETLEVSAPPCREERIDKSTLLGQSGDDKWMCVGSANANVRSFELDSELNVQTFADASDPTSPGPAGSASTDTPPATGSPVT